ncbi:MAG: RNA 2',3'-cyclic phosphodiesterase [Gammaproteobacteria bacterium]
MTFPKVWRIFFAVDMAPDLKNRLGDFITTLKERSKSHAIRWSRPENLHITLQFLAEVSSDDVTMIAKEVRKIVEEACSQIEISFGQITLFPHPSRPRVIVLDVSAQEALAELSVKIGKGIQAANYKIEDKPFKAHLTLGRIKQPKGVNLRFLADVVSPITEVVTVKEIVLFRSEPQSDGSRYSLIEKISLCH